MAKVKLLGLEPSEEAALREIIKKGTDWRERDRAETILLLAAGMSVQDIAKQQGWCIESVRIRRRKWLKFGFASLSDQPRSGAPSKLNDEHRRRLAEWVEAEPLSARELITRLERDYQVTVGSTTLRTELSRLGYVWKRTRYSLKKSATRSASSEPKATSPS
jgi:transposase